MKGPIIKAQGSNSLLGDALSKAMSAGLAPLLQGLRQKDAKPVFDDLEAWLTDVLARIADHPFNRVDELLPSRQEERGTT